MTALVEQYRDRAGITDPFRLTCAATDGKAIHAVRYATHGRQKSLYISEEIEALREIDGGREDIPDDAIIVLSEPLDDCEAHWREVPDNSFVTVANNEIQISDFSP